VAKKHSGDELKEQERRRRITRVHLGASLLEKYESPVLEAFLDTSWMHLGTETPKHRRGRLRGALRRGLAKVRKSGGTSEAEVEALYGRTNFEPFYFRKGDILPLDDGSISFIYSEHFFEHLFRDEALSLFRECHRILRPFGVIRTCVPDSDLRTYEPPEPEGYPDIDLPLTHPDKHKTRWSVYSLSEALREAGMESVPLRYCDRKGNYIRTDPCDIRDSYENCPDGEMIFNLTYVMRPDSLIVDGIKKGIPGGKAP